VRRALALAVDRGALARGWAGSRPLCQIVPVSIPGHVPYCPFTRHPNEAGGWNGPDLAKARALIAASHTTGVRITYSASAGVTAPPGPLDTYRLALRVRPASTFRPACVPSHAQRHASSVTPSRTWTGRCASERKSPCCLTPSPGGPWPR
jgi:hypothetical protein